MLTSGADASQVISLGILEAGRGLAPPGAPGLSARARGLTNQYLSQSRGNMNALFSSTTGAGYTIEDMQKQILALRAQKSPRQLASSLLKIEPDPNKGQNVDQKV